MKKKILLVIPSLEIGGGAERVVSDLSIKLSKEYNVFIITFHNSKTHYPFKGYYYSLNEALNSNYKIIRPFKIYKLIKRISPEIIISFMDHVNLITILTKLIFHIKIPLIISIRGNPKMAYKENNRYIHYLIKIFYNFKIVNKIITVSKDLQDILKRDYHIKPYKLKTIYNGIDLEKINQLKNEEISENKEIYNNNIIKFINIGRLSEEKGHFHLINAFNEVKKQVSNTILFIIGTGELKTKIEKWIEKLDLKQDVLLIGRKINPYKFLKNSDIFILSSIHEGLPLVLLEALACGLPIISTDCPTGPKEILDDGKFGILVRVGDSRQLAEKMTWLAKNKNERESLKSRSIQRAKYFNKSKILKEWTDLIEEITE